MHSVPLRLLPGTLLQQLFIGRQPPPSRHHTSCWQGPQLWLTAASESPACYPITMSWVHPLQREGLLLGERSVYRALGQVKRSVRSWPASWGTHCL